jgi:hypothetical protein
MHKISRLEQLAIVVGGSLVFAAFLAAVVMLWRMALGPMPSR